MFVTCKTYGLTEAHGAICPGSYRRPLQWLVHMMLDNVSLEFANFD